MRTLRIWLLLFLAVLLPIRGAVAAAMLCPPAGEPRVQLQPAVEAAHAHASAHADHAQHAPATHAHAATGDHHPLGQADKCSACSASCSATPLVSSFRSDFQVRELTDTAFPELLAPAPTFISGGPERPPRSI